MLRCCDRVLGLALSILQRRFGGLENKWAKWMLTLQKVLESRVDFDCGGIFQSFLCTSLRLNYKSI